MVGNDANADILTLRYCLSHAVECINILSEHPAWDRGPRRLCLCGIEDSNGEVCSKCDHITPDSWEGNVNVRDSLWSQCGTWVVRHSHPNSQPAKLKKPCWSWRAKDTTWNSPSIKLLRAPRNLTTTSAMVHLLLHPPAPLVPKMRQHLSRHSNQAKVSLSFSTFDKRRAQISKGDEPILDLEDHASIETSRDGRGQFSPLVNIGNGKEVPKACVLQELERATFSTVPGSMDRLNWCAGLSRYLKTSALPDLACDLIDSTSGALLSVGDPAATVVQSKRQFFLAIVQINEILVDTSPVLEISPHFLMELTVTVQFQIYQIIETSQDDPDVDGADWKWNRNLERTVLKTAGSFIQVINPAIAIPEVNTPIYYFRTDELRAFAACLFSSVPVQD